jgi:hypothetical protein
VQGHPDPLAGTIDAPIGRHPRIRGSSPSRPTARTRSPTTRRSRRSPRHPSWRSIWRPDAPTRSACTWRPIATRAWATRCTAPTRRCRRASGSPGSGCTRTSLVRAPGHDRMGHVQERLSGRSRARAGRPPGLSFDSCRRTYVRVPSLEGCRCPTVLGSPPTRRGARRDRTGRADPRRHAR